MRRHLRWIKSWPDRTRDPWPYPDGRAFSNGFSKTDRDFQMLGVRQELFSPRPWIGRAHLRIGQTPGDDYHASTLAIMDDAGSDWRIKVFWQGSFIYLFSVRMSGEQPAVARHELTDLDLLALDPPITFGAQFEILNAEWTGILPEWVDRPYRWGGWNPWRHGGTHQFRDDHAPFWNTFTINWEFHHINGCDAAILDSWELGQSPPSGELIDPISPAQESALIAALQAEGFDFDEAKLFYDTPPSA